MNAATTTRVKVFTSEPGPDGQFMYTVYTDATGKLRTAAWRRSPADTWSPEHILIEASS